MIAFAHGHKPFLLRADGFSSRQMRVDSQLPFLNIETSFALGCHVLHSRLLRVSLISKGTSNFERRVSLLLRRTFVGACQSGALKNKRW